jgi:methionyl-tRNA formyltransferase
LFRFRVKFIIGVMSTQPKFIFFGTPRFAAIVLDELESAGFLPALVVTAPDKPKGRGMKLAPSDVANWATERNIPVLKPATLKGDDAEWDLRAVGADLHIVAAYGKIIPKNILDIPPKGALNVHPSLLPKFRGPSPIESAIISNEHHTGVSIMLLDEEMDHGPVLAQRERIIKDWPPKGSVLTDDLAHFGGALLAEIIPEYMNGLKAGEQEHTRATYCKKIEKSDGEIDIVSGDPVKNYKKIRAFDDWPTAYYFIERGGKKIRVRVTDAHLLNGKLEILRVIPEGKKEMSYADFQRGS